MDQEPRIEDMKCKDIDLIRLGDMAFRLPLIAIQMGHSSLKKFGTYFHDDGTATSEFLVGFVELCEGERTLEDFCEEWFNGEDGANQLLANRLGRAHGSSQEEPEHAV